MGFKSFWFEEIVWWCLSQGYQPLCKEAGVYFISSKESSVNRSERMRMFRLKAASTQHSAVSAIHACESYSVECESMLYVSNRLPYLWGIINSFFSSFFDF